MTLVFDPQARGWHDDNTESGVQRTKSAKGDLISVPFRAGQIVVTTTGSASAAVATSGAVAVEGGAYDHGFLLVTVPALTVSSGLIVGQGVKVAFPVYGTTVGLRWQKGYNQPNNGDFTVQIDGVGYHVVNGDYSPYDLSLLSNIWNESALEVIADDLPDQKHYVELIFPAQGVGGASSQWVIWGFLGERRAGYWDHPPIGNIINTPAAVPTSVGNVPIGNSSGRTLRAWKSVTFKNTAGTATTVQLQYGGSNVPLWSALLAAAGSAGDSAIWDPGFLVQIDTSLKWLASQAGTNGSVVGVF